LIHAISTNIGGAKRHLDNMVANMAKMAPDKTFFIVLNDSYEASWPSENVKILRYPSSLSNGIERVKFDNFEINRLIDELAIDVLVSFANFGPYKAKCKHILFETNALYFCDNIRHLYPLKSRIVSDIRKYLIKLSGSHADLIVTPSRSLKEQLADSLGFPKEKMEVVHHAMERSSLGEVTRERASDDTFRFICTSHLTRHKRVEVMLEAAKILKARPDIPPFTITCTFDRKDNTGYYDELMEFIEKENLDETVNFIGRIDQNAMADLYATSDCMLHTTACESFGFALLEAKVFELPMICSDIPVNKEIAKDSAVYFKTDDSVDLADKMEKFMNDGFPNLSFEDELIDWNWEKYAARMLKIVERTANG
jgi:glycosyltransferase involved in cell wall biosynthesis